MHPLGTLGTVLSTCPTRLHPDLTATCGWRWYYGNSASRSPRLRAVKWLAPMTQSRNRTGIETQIRPVPRSLCFIASASQNIWQEPPACLWLSYHKTEGKKQNNLKHNWANRQNDKNWKLKEKLRGHVNHPPPHTVRESPACLNTPLTGISSSPPCSIPAGHTTTSSSVLWPHRLSPHPPLPLPWRQMLCLYWSPSLGLSRARLLSPPGLYSWGREGDCFLGKLNSVPPRRPENSAQTQQWGGKNQWRMTKGSLKNFF